MAVSLLSHEVCDLCIGKPPLRSLPITATVGEAVVALKLYGETFISVVSPPFGRTKPAAIAGKICMVDVLCYLCAEPNIAAPAAALKNPVSTLLSKDSAARVRRVEPKSSILEALDLIIDGSAQSLVVPIRSWLPKKKLIQQELCWLTQEDLVRFFVNNIFHFNSVASLSVTALGLVRPPLLSVRHHEPALSALPLIRAALDLNTSVAVVTDDYKLIGEISPSTLASCDETVAAAIAGLSAGDLMAYIDCCSCGSASESVLLAVKARLREKGLGGMVELLDGEDLLLSLPSTPVSSVSSLDEEAETAKKRRPRRMKSGSYSARMGRRSEEAIVCHPESSLVAVMVQALVHRVSYAWVVEEDYELLGILTFEDVLSVFREQFQ